MKDQIRILGVDDGPFKFDQKTVPIVGVIIRPQNYIEGICQSEVIVDGKDANTVIKKMIEKSHYRDQLGLIMFDGVALGGFNVINIEDLYNDLNIPITTITRTKPDFDVIKETLKKHFTDWKTRWEIINNLELTRIDTNYNPIFIKFIGMNKSEIQRYIKLTTIRGVLPEPIRIAHLMATAMVKGESAGRA